MRVLYVSPAPPLKNGIADYADAFGKALALEGGIHVDRYSHLENHDIDSPLQAYRLLKRLRAYRDILRYDVVHFEIGTGQTREFYLLAGVVFFFPEIKTVVTLHDPPFLTAVPFRFLGLDRLPRVFRSIRKVCDLTLGRIWSKSILDKAGDIFVLTEKARAWYRCSGRPNVHYLPHLGYDFDTGEHIYRDKGFSIIFFGFLGFKKGVHVLIRSIGRLVRQNEELRRYLKLVICGGSPAGRGAAGYADELAALALKEAWDNITFAGHVAEDDKRRRFTDADILVMPYLNQESLSASGVLIQGMSWGMPIIATRVKGFDTEIDDGITGVLVQPDNECELCEALERLIYDCRRRRDLGRAAQAHIRKEHSPGRIAEIARSVYAGAEPEETHERRD